MVAVLGEYVKPKRIDAKHRFETVMHLSSLRMIVLIQHNFFILLVNYAI